MASPPISDGVLRQLKALKEAAMLDTVTVHGPSTRTVTSLPNGGWTVDETATPPVTTKGLLGPLSKTAIERLQAGQLEYEGREQLEVPKNVQVSGDDTVEVTSYHHGTTQTYKVEGVTPLGTYAVSRVLIVKAVA